MFVWFFFQKILTVLKRVFRWKSRWFGCTQLKLASFAPLKLDGWWPMFKGYVTWFLGSVFFKAWGCYNGCWKVVQTMDQSKSSLKVKSLIWWHQPSFQNKTVQDWKRKPYCRSSFPWTLGLHFASEFFIKLYYFLTFNHMLEHYWIPFLPLSNLRGSEIY